MDGLAPPATLAVAERDTLADHEGVDVVETDAATDSAAVDDVVVVGEYDTEEVVDPESPPGTLAVGLSDTDPE